MTRRIAAARAAESSSQELQEQERRHKELQNQFQAFLQETRDRIDDRSYDVQRNLFALNELKLQTFLQEWKNWFQAHMSSDNATLEGKLAAIRREREEEMTRFEKEFRHRQAEEAKLEAERAAEEAKRVREEKEREREEKAKRDLEQLARYRSFLTQSVQLCSHLTDAELLFLLQQRRLSFSLLSLI